MKKSTLVREPNSIYADLGLPDAEERETKMRLAIHVNDVITARSLRQTDVSAALSIPQPRVSSLVNYKLDHFSVERLLEFLTLLGQQVEITIRPARRKRDARVTVRGVR